MDFDATLKTHLNSMKEKDFDTFIQTVCLEKITLIMPNGNLIPNGDGFEKLHRDWFADEDWSVEYDLSKTEVGNDFGYATLAVDYSDCDAEGNAVEMKYYLTLIFQKFGEQWLLTHDQNTIFK